MDVEYIDAFRAFLSLLADSIEQGLNSLDKFDSLRIIEHKGTAWFEDNTQVTNDLWIKYRVEPFIHGKSAPVYVFDVEALRNNIKSVLLKANEKDRRIYKRYVEGELGEFFLNIEVYDKWIEKNAAKAYYEGYYSIGDFITDRIIHGYNRSFKGFYNVLRSVNSLLKNIRDTFNYFYDLFSISDEEEINAASNKGHIKLTWQGDKKVLINVLRQIKNAHNKKGQSLMKESYEDIALFLIQHVNGFESDKISTIRGLLTKELTDPKGNFISLDLTEPD